MPGAERKKGASGSPVKEVSQVRDFFKSRSFKVLAGVVLVLLGVVPTIALAVVVDALFALWGAWLKGEAND